MKSQEKVESSAAIAQAIDKLPGAITAQGRAEKKAARRAAFIQEVAEAVHAMQSTVKFKPTPGAARLALALTSRAFAG